MAIVILRRFSHNRKLPRQVILIISLNPKNPARHRKGDDRRLAGTWLQHPNAHRDWPVYRLFRHADCASGRLVFLSHPDLYRRALERVIDLALRDCTPVRDLAGRTSVLTLRWNWHRRLEEVAALECSARRGLRFGWRYSGRDHSLRTWRRFRSVRQTSRLVGFIDLRSGRHCRGIVFSRLRDRTFAIVGAEPVLGRDGSASGLCGRTLDRRLGEHSDRLCHRRRSRPFLSVASRFGGEHDRSFPGRFYTERVGETLFPSELTKNALTSILSEWERRAEMVSCAFPFPLPLGEEAAKRQVRVKLEDRK